MNSWKHKEETAVMDSHENYNEDAPVRETRGQKHYRKKQDMEGRKRTLRDHRRGCRKN